MNITDLTPEQKAALRAQLEQEANDEQTRITAERETYKTLVDATVREQVERLKEISALMIAAKQAVFAAFATIIESKNELYNAKANRVSDTFTTSDGVLTLKIGRRNNEGWDDTVSIGEQKVMDYLKTLAKDADSADLVDTIVGFLAKDRKGNLKASKILELERLAVKKGDAGFLDGIRIIKDAYRPVASCRFVEVTIKDEKGFDHSLPLSMSASNG